MIERAKQTLEQVRTELSKASWATVPVVAFAIVHIWIFLFVAVSRIGFPLDLEWMEGGQLLEAREIMEGRHPYAPPSADHIAFPYQPLYPAIIALLAKVFGLSLAVGRGVSIVSMLALGGILGYATYHVSHKSLRWAVISVGLLFSLYRIGGFWFDLVRVDSLFLALVAGLLVVAERTRSVVWSIVLAVLAFKAKQLSILFIGIPIVGFLERKPKDAIVYGAGVAVILGIDHLIENALTGGWYSFFTAKVPGGQPYIMERVRRHFWEETGESVPLLVVVGSWACISRLARGKIFSHLDPWTLAAIAGVASAVLAWSRPGGYLNNFLTAFVFLIPLTVRKLQQWEVTLRRRRWHALPMLLLLGHFFQQVPEFRTQLPNKRDRAAATELIAFLHGMEGEILIPEHPWYAVLAGKKPSYHAVELWEVAMTDETVNEPVKKRLKDRAYSHVIVSGFDLGNPPDLAKYYERKTTVPVPFVRSFTGTGGIEPKQLWVPKPQP